MTKGKRRKILNMIVEAVRKKTYFREVHGALPPEAMPKAGNLPAAFVFRMPEVTDPLTQQEYRGRIRFAVIGYVTSNENIELEKADCQDMIEEALQNLMKDSTFLNEAVRIELQNADPGPLILRDLGYAAGIYPPFGAVRINGEVEYDYTAIS